METLKNPSARKRRVLMHRPVRHRIVMLEGFYAGSKGKKVANGDKRSYIVLFFFLFFFFLKAELSTVGQESKKVKGLRNTRASVKPGVFMIPDVCQGQLTCEKCFAVLRQPRPTQT
jgi:hypothetical protein